jgi:hypothetical protein
MVYLIYREGQGYIDILVKLYDDRLIYFPDLEFLDALRALMTLE